MKNKRILKKAIIIPMLTLTFICSSFFIKPIKAENPIKVGAKTLTGEVLNAELVVANLVPKAAEVIPTWSENVNYAITNALSGAVQTVSSNLPALTNFLPAVMDYVENPTYTGLENLNNTAVSLKYDGGNKNYYTTDSHDQTLNYNPITYNPVTETYDINYVNNNTNISYTDISIDNTYITYNSTTNNYYYSFEFTTNNYISIINNYNSTQIIDNGETIQLYYQLPDGSDSFNLTEETARKGYKTSLSVGSYNNNIDTTELQSLYHFDKNEKNEMNTNTQLSIQPNSIQYQNDEGEFNTAIALENNFEINVNNASQNNSNLLTLENNEEDSINNYYQLDYIQSTGTQYIDTNFIPNQNTKIQIKYMHTEYENDNPLFGTRNFNYINPYVLWAHPYESNSNTTFVIGNNSYNADRLDLIRINTIIDMSIDKNQWTYNGYTQNINYTGTISPNKSLILLSTWSEDYIDERRFIGKLYYCKIYDNETLVRDYVPVKSQNNEIGLYDKVSNTFYGNDGAGEFIAGNVIQNPTEEDNPPIPSSQNKAYSFRMLPYSNNNYSISINGTELGSIEKKYESIDFYNIYENENYIRQETPSGAFPWKIIYNNQEYYTLGADLTRIGETPDYNYVYTAEQLRKLAPYSNINGYNTDNATRILNVTTYNIRTASSGYIYYFKDNYGNTFNSDNSIMYSSTSQSIPLWTKTSGTKTRSYNYVNNSYYLYEGITNNINFNMWNYFYISKDGTIYINGVETEYTISNTNNLNIEITSDSITLFDELAVFNIEKNPRPPILPYTSGNYYTIPNNVKNNQLLLQTNIPIANWKFGGIRQTNAQLGDVYISVDDYGYIKVLEIYDGIDWLQINGAIYNEYLNLWITAIGFNIYNNNWNYVEETFTVSTDDGNTFIRFFKSIFDPITNKIDSIITTLNSLTNGSNDEQQTNNELWDYVDQLRDEMSDFNPATDEEHNINVNEVTKLGILQEATGMDKALDILGENGFSVTVMLPLVAGLVGIIIL